jgi:hypothetical protein
MAAPVRFQLRRDDSASWTLKNPVLLAGEPGLEEDTDKWKSGNGSTPWNNLPYMVGVAPDDDGPSLVLLYENAKV